MSVYITHGFGTSCFRGEAGCASLSLYLIELSHIVLFCIFMNTDIDSEIINVLADPTRASVNFQTREIHAIVDIVTLADTLYHTLTLVTY